jgi:L-glyceraldehyde 3-phosphate reductase
MAALDLIVRQGKALYVGISNYSDEQTEKASKILKSLGTPCLIHQPKYSMFERWVEKGLLDTLENNKIGCIAFSPLAQGLLTDKYLKGIPEGSRASKEHGFLRPEQITKEVIAKVNSLNEIAKKRNQTLAQMAIAWLLKDNRITSVLVGASKIQQLADSLTALNNLNFNKEELNEIEEIIREK